MTNRIETRLLTDKDDQLFKLWYDALRIPGKTLEQTIAEEVADYFGKSVDEVVEFWYYSTKQLKLEWDALNPQTEEDILSYYDKNTTYIYELSYWHTLHKNLGLIENARSLELALSHPGRKYLDFGGGTGSNIILFHKHGFECALADISTSLLNFAKARFKRREINCRVVDLKADSLPDEYFDFVTAVEILEHTPHPVEIMKQIVRATKKGGLITAWIPFFKDELRPMHLVTNINVAEQFLALGLFEVSRDDQMLIRVYQKV